MLSYVTFRLALENLISLYDREDTKPDIPTNVDMVYEKQARSREAARNYLLPIDTIVNEMADMLLYLFDITQPDINLCKQQ
jgi:hypothetical protein